MNLDQFKVTPQSKVSLSEIPSRGEETIELFKDGAKEALREVRSRLDQKQRTLFAQKKHRILIILQGMDTSGKDSTIRSVFKGLNPQGVAVFGFSKPSEYELSKDYLWRVHAKVPSDGKIVVFNRSHYEDVLVPRVEELVPEDQWRKRYDHIRNFEQMLMDEGTTILKFFLHIDKDKQKSKIQKRLDRPDKLWKFTKEDLDARSKWDDYQLAYEEALSETSTDQAPWYIVPANQKWARNIIIASIIEEKLNSLDIELPPPHINPDDYQL